jgi:hypothetical protein
LTAKNAKSAKKGKGLGNRGLNGNKGRTPERSESISRTSVVGSLPYCAVAVHRLRMFFALFAVFAVKAVRSLF